MEAMSALRRLRRNLGDGPKKPVSEERRRKLEVLQAWRAKGFSMRDAMLLSGIGTVIRKEK